MPLSRRDPAAGAASTAPPAAGRSRIDYHLAPWREPSVLINCLTISMVACLVPRQPFSSDQIHLTLSTFAFTSLAFVNHLFPKRLDRLTHVVKAAYTQLLFASVGPAMGLGARWWLLPAAVSGFDLVPLAGQRGGPCGRPVAEGIGATARWAAIAAAFWLARPPWWSIVVYGACTGAYFHERRRRIGRGRRHEYGWLHCLEHLAVWVFVLAVDGPRLDRTLSIRLHLGLFLSIALALVILGVITNIRACRSIERQLPVWFDPALRELIVRKSRANARSHRLQHYIVKPFSPKILNRAVSWSDIESMIAGIEVAGTFDTVVGIASGGAFIARRVADRIGVATVHYVHSRLWSRLSLVGNALTSLRYYAGLPNGTNPRFVERDVDLRGKRVLLVDDSVCTGATLACVAGLCRKGGATHVATLALFSNPDHPTDYCYGTSNTPLVWPWGWEAD